MTAMPPIVDREPGRSRERAAGPGEGIHPRVDAIAEVPLIDTFQGPVAAVWVGAVAQRLLGAVKGDREPPRSRSASPAGDPYRALS